MIEREKANGKVRTNVTIADVALRAGCSKTTISRYLNGKFEFMSAESKERIAAVIEEMNYRPNNLARSLKSSRSRLIGVIMADISNPFSSILVKGIGDACAAAGYHVMIANMDNDPVREKDYILSMLDQQVDGLILNTTCSNNEFLQEMADRRVPMVLVDRAIEPAIFDVVKTNDFQATLDLLQYVAEQGFGKVGFFSQPVGNIGPRLNRRKAYRQMCDGRLKQAPQEYAVEISQPEAVKEQVRDFLQRNGEEKKFIFTANGVAMLSLLHAINELGLRIPEDVGIGGFDDWSWASLVGPGITTIAQPSYDVGAKSVERLLLRIQRGGKAKPKIFELPNKLILRGSSQL